MAGTVRTSMANFFERLRLSGIENGNNFPSKLFTLHVISKSYKKFDVFDAENLNFTCLAYVVCTPSILKSARNDACKADAKNFKFFFVNFSHAKKRAGPGKI